MEGANIFNIQHFSVHDGPGVRTVVFFKGCSLHCKWCHNPESIRPEAEILWYPEKCIGCRACEVQCPMGAHSFTAGVHRIDKGKCSHCFLCCEECYADALVRVGEEKSAEEIFREIMRNKAYFDQSGGGATFSGGECMLQPKALHELLTLCRQSGIHTAVDTAGNVPWQSFETIKDLTDLFLYDLKALDPDVHRACTGAGNERILDNFKKLAEAGSNILVRIPYIPGYNDQELEGIAAFLSAWPQIKAELLPYHSLGNSKHRALQEEDLLDVTAPTKETVTQLKQKYGFL